MREIRIRPSDLVPTDPPRTLMGILRFVPLILNKKPIKSIVVVPARVSKDFELASGTRGGRLVYFVCSGNHRSAAAHICGVRPRAKVIETAEDLAVLSEGRVCDMKSVPDLIQACWKRASDGRYLEGRWDEYLRMITDSGSVGFDEELQVPWVQMGARNFGRRLT